MQRCLEYLRLIKCGRRLTWESRIILGFCFGDLEGQSRLKWEGRPLRRGMLSLKCVWVGGEVSDKPPERAPEVRSQKCQ